MTTAYQKTPANNVNDSDLIDRLDELRDACVAMQRQILSIQIAHGPDDCQCDVCGHRSDDAETMHRHLAGLSWAIGIVVDQAIDPIGS